MGESYRQKRKNLQEVIILLSKTCDDCVYMNDLIKEL